MDKKEGNFWWGLALGSFLSGKRDNGGEKKGCLSNLIETAVGLVIIVVAINLFTKYGIAGIIIPVVLFIALCVFIGWHRGKKEHAAQTADEALQLFQNGQYTLALEKAESVAEKNSLAADVAGVCYRNALGCEKNPQKAFSYFEKAKDKNIEAAGNYGAMLVKGEGCEKDPKQGLKYLQKAVLQKSEYACFEYGCMLLEGKYVPQDVEVGKRNLRIASEAGMQSAAEVLEKYESQNQ